MATLAIEYINQLVLLISWQSIFYFVVAGMIHLVIGYSGDISFFNWIAFFLSLIMGLLIWYSIDFSIACICFWVKNFSVSGWLSHELLKFSMRPDSIYSGLIRKTFFTLVPMSLLSSVPTRNLIYGFRMDYFLLQFFVMILFIGASRLIWKRGLIQYESASS